MCRHGDIMISYHRVPSGPHWAWTPHRFSSLQLLQIRAEMARSSVLSGAVRVEPRAEDRSVASEVVDANLLKLLIRCGVDVDATSSYNESALSVMSQFGRFEGVRLLLSVGADQSPLRWTALIEAVAIGTLDHVRREARTEVLEGTDRWSRTAWLVALLVGDRDKAQLLLDRGADQSARTGGGTPALFYAVDARRPDLVRRLLAAGANPADLSRDGARARCRLNAGHKVLKAVSPDAFGQGRTRRFGGSNPERTIEVFWEAMIRCGVSAYEARSTLSVSAEHSGFPTWSTENSSTAWPSSTHRPVETLRAGRSGRDQSQARYGDSRRKARTASSSG